MVYGRGVMVMGEGGRCFLSQENLTILTVVSLPNMRVPLGIKK